MNIETAYKNTVGLKIAFELEDNTQTPYMQNGRIFYKKPSGKTGFWTAQIDGNIIFRITEFNDLDEVGIYKLQPYVEFTNGLKNYGEIVNLNVKDVLMLVGEN